jgi:hypothetical protein
VIRDEFRHANQCEGNAHKDDQEDGRLHPGSARTVEGEPMTGEEKDRATDAHGEGAEQKQAELPCDHCENLVGIEGQTGKEA